MPNLNLDIMGAYDFYEHFIMGYTTDKKAIYEKYGFTLQGSVGFKDWEVFAAILLKDKAKPGDGADLYRHEVKSASSDGSFEYQYHKEHGLDKLKGDKTVDHVFISRSPDYANVSVWWVSRRKLASVFKAWEPELRKNYSSGIKQRFRKSVTFNFVKENGILILEIQGGALTGSYSSANSGN